MGAKREITFCVGEIETLNRLTEVKIKRDIRSVNMEHTIGFFY